MPQLLRHHVLSSFACLGDRCEDTCCKGWSMQVDAATLTRYRNEKPELLAAVEDSPDAPAIMRKDPDSGYCIKLEGGLCGIHKAFGERFLGDACYFYPRVTRRLGDQTWMGATLSCPEITRLALGLEQGNQHEQVEADRLPDEVKDYLPPDLSASEAMSIHEAFLDAAEDGSASAERLYMRMNSASRSLERIECKKWPAMASFYLAHAEMRLLPAQPEAADPFHLLHALCGLIIASKKEPFDRLRQTIGEMEWALAVTLDWENVHILTNAQSVPAYQRLLARWREKGEAAYAPILRRYLQMQLSMALYPFAGLGNSLSERITILGVRLATVRLALMCAYHRQGGTMTQDTVVRVVQSLSRFLDHLGDPAFSLQIYHETGWNQEQRMRGLLEN